MEGNSILSGYCGATWVSDLSDGRSIIGYVFLQHNGAISWDSRKQTTVAPSSTTSEYQSLSSATMETLWLRGLAIELGLPGNEHVQIRCDNNT